MQLSKGKKRLLQILFMVAAFLLVCFFLDFALYPCTYMRNDVHSVTTEHHDVVFLGTSDGKMGIDPDTVLADTELTGHNLCNGNQYPVDSYYLLKLLVEKQKPSVIVYEADMNYLTSEKERGNNYLLFYHEFPFSHAKMSYFFDTVVTSDFRALFFPFYEYPLVTELSRMGETMRIKWNRDYGVEHLKGETAFYHENGYMERYPVDVADFPAITARSFSAEEVHAENMEYIGKMISLCREEGIRFVAVITPQADTVVAAFPEAYATAWDYLESYFAEQGVDCYNFNTAYYEEASHDTSVFVDYNGHMNGDGARAFSATLGELLFGTKE